MSEPRPCFILREMLGKPYVRKVLQTDGTYRTAPRVRFSPEFTAALRTLALEDLARCQEARLREMNPATEKIQ